MEYIGFSVTWDGIGPINKEEESIINMMTPKTPKQVHAFIVLLN